MREMGTVTEFSDTDAPTQQPRRRRGIAANTLMNAGAQIASILSTLVFFPLLVRAFGAGVYGVYVIAISTIGLSAMFDFGIGVSTVRLVARRVSLDDAHGFATVVWTALALMVALGLAVAAVIAGIGLVAGGVFNVNAEQAQLLRTLLFVGALMQLWYWPSTVPVNVLSGLERYDVVSATSFVGTCANVLAILIVLLGGFGPVVLMALSAATMVLTTCINLAALVRVRPAGPLLIAPAAPVAQEIVTGGAPVFVASLAQFFNREQVDRLVLGVVLGPAAVVLYEVAAKLSMLVTQVITLPTSALLPVASGLSAREDSAAIRDLFVRGSRYMSFLVAPVLMVLLMLAGPFIRVWFGAGYEVSIVIARLLILAQIFVPLFQMGDPILIGAGRFALWVRRGLALALLNLGISIVLVHTMGTIGVAWGTMLTGMLEFPLYAQVILRHTELSPGAWLRPAGVAYLLLPVAAIVAWGLGSTRLVGTLPGVFVAGALSVDLYWLCVYAFLLSAEERSGVRSRVRGLVTRGRATS